MNLKEKLKDVKEYFSPKIIGELNEVYVKVAKIKGDKIPWHSHEYEDELFYIVKGSLVFEVEGEDSFILNEGDVYIVKKGIKHRVSSIEECQIMLIENKTTAHTGNVKSEITRNIDEQRFNK